MNDLNTEEGKRNNSAKDHLKETKILSRGSPLQLILKTATNLNISIQTAIQPLMFLVSIFMKGIVLYLR